MLKNDNNISDNDLTLFARILLLIRSNKTNILMSNPPVHFIWIL